jgi:hypothetical protein
VKFSSYIRENTACHHKYHYRNAAYGNNRCLSSMVSSNRYTKNIKYVGKKPGPFNAYKRGSYGNY